MNKKIAVSLGLIQSFVAIGAIPAGLSMIIDPSGSGVGIPREILAGSPFQDFLFPGLFLFFVNGLFNVAGAVLSFRKHNSAGFAGMILGVLLMVWICIQVYFTGLISFLQPLFFAVGVIEIALSLIIRKGKE